MLSSWISLSYFALKWKKKNKKKYNSNRLDSYCTSCTSKHKQKNLCLVRFNLFHILYNCFIIYFIISCVQLDTSTVFQHRAVVVLPKISGRIFSSNLSNKVIFNLIMNIVNLMLMQKRFEFLNEKSFDKFIFVIKLVNSINL